MELSQDQIKLYKHYANMRLPRHTSYPATPFWHELNQEEQNKAINLAKKSSYPLSLYFHFPYCRSLCYYCGCNKEIYDDHRLKTKDPRQNFIANILTEIKFYAKHFSDKKIAQIHFGGGTPTFFTTEQLNEVMNEVKANFSLAPKAEVAIEIDPRTSKPDTFKKLHQIGFNRISLGVQDFDPKVQKAVNRIQPFELVAAACTACQKLNLPINFDLIYGLPYQNQTRMQKTLAQVIQLQPNRIAYYRLAWIPEMMKWQKSFTAAEMPTEDEVLGLNLLGIQSFRNAGYKFLGLDHFVQNSDSLNLASQQKQMRRSFQGMSIGRHYNIIGIGPSAISQVEGAFWQNLKEINKWQSKIKENILPIKSGILLSQDDLHRQNLIEELYCYGQIDYQKFQKRWQINFQEYFANEIKAVQQLDKSLLQIEPHMMKLTPDLGRLLVRVVAANFDSYFQNKELSKRQHFSQV